jgi:hypothetical protein
VYKSSGTEQYSAELIQVGEKSGIHKLWNKEELPDQRKVSIGVGLSTF